MWSIIIHNRGTRGDEHVRVTGDDNRYRDAVFATKADAIECAKVIAMLRRDTAFDGCTVYKRQGKMMK